MMVLIANLLQGLMMIIWNILLVPRSILLNFTGLLISFNNVVLTQRAWCWKLWRFCDFTLQVSQPQFMDSGRKYYESPGRKDYIISLFPAKVVSRVSTFSCVDSPSSNSSQRALCRGSDDVYYIGEDPETFVMTADIFPFILMCNTVFVSQSYL